MKYPTRTFRALLRPPDRRGYRRVRIGGTRYRVKLTHNSTSTSCSARIAVRPKSKLRYQPISSITDRPYDLDGKTPLEAAADLIDMHADRNQ